MLFVCFFVCFVVVVVVVVCFLGFFFFGLTKMRPVISFL